MMFIRPLSPLDEVYETAATLLTGDRIGVSVANRGASIRTAMASASMTIAIRMEPSEARALAAELIAAANASDGIPECA